MYMEKRSLIIYGAVVLLGLGVLVGMIVWLRSRDAGAGDEVLQVQTTRPTPTPSNVSGTPKIRPYTKIENQPTADVYTTGTPIHEDSADEILPPQQVTPQ